MKNLLILQPRVWHRVCCIVALLSCLPLIWPRMLPRSWRADAPDYAGALLMGSFLLSFALITITSIAMLLRLRNLRTLGQLIVWAAQWGITVGVFCALSYIANPPDISSSPLPTAANRVDMEESFSSPTDELTGPDSLCIPIFPENYIADSIHSLPNLVTLEKNHGDLLRSYIESSPRWDLYTNDNTFYAKPGHVVMQTPAASGIPGLVHVAFHRLVGGDHLPAGFSVVKPGDPMPTTPDGSEQVPDLAVELSQGHFLLLAWRGTSHADTAHRAMNAALAAVDSMVQPLVKSPTQETLRHVLEGNRELKAEEPSILLCEPPSQFGTYQAEVYVNPGEPGTCILRIVDVATNTCLRLFSLPARFSANPHVQFRHDIPGSIPPQLRIASFGYQPGLLPVDAPIFAIRSGPAHQSFTVALELQFVPAHAPDKGRLLVRRCFQVQACEKTDQSPPTRTMMIDD